MDFSDLGSNHQHHHQQAPSDPSQSQNVPYFAQHYHDASAYHRPQYFPQDYYSSSSALSAFYQPPPPGAGPASTPATAPFALGSSHLVHQHYQNYQYQPCDVLARVLNDAAAAALLQLTQFAGTMGAAERGMAEMDERPWQGNSVGVAPSLIHRHHRQLSLPTVQDRVISIRPAVCAV